MRSPGRCASSILGVAIRLEVPAFRTTRGHVDLMVRSDGVWNPIELKYVPGRLEFTDEQAEKFNLLNTDAADLPRAGFVKDVWRLETLVADRPGSVGWAILLSNLPSYWSPPSTADTSDAAFRIHEGRVLSGQLGWRLGTAASTTRGHESFPIAGQLPVRLARLLASRSGTKPTLPLSCDRGPLATTSAMTVATSPALSVGRRGRLATTRSHPVAASTRRQHLREAVNRWGRDRLACRRRGELQYVDCTESMFQSGVTHRLA